MSWNADPDSYYFIIAVDEGIPAVQVDNPYTSIIASFVSMLNISSILKSFIISFLSLLALSLSTG